MAALQRTDTALQALANRRVRLPQRDELATTTAARNALRAERDDAATRASAAVADIDGLEAKGHDLDTKKARLEGQLKTVIAPREAEALMHEIATIDQQHSELDDVELEAMERQAEAEAQIARLEEDLPAADAAVESAAAAVKAGEDDIDAEVATLQATRLEQVSLLTAAEVATYDGLQKAHSGLGIAVLEGAMCTGCHLDLTRGELEAVKQVPADEFAECPQCNRALAR